MAQYVTKVSITQITRFQIPTGFKNSVFEKARLGDLACSRLSVVGDGEKGRAREKNEGGLRRLSLALVLPRFFLARFRSSPTTESLEQATW